MKRRLAAVLLGVLVLVGYYVFCQNTAQAKAGKTGPEGGEDYSYNLNGRTEWKKDDAAGIIGPQQAANIAGTLWEEGYGLSLEDLPFDLYWIGKGKARWRACVQLPDSGSRAECVVDAATGAVLSCGYQPGETEFIEHEGAQYLPFVFGEGDVLTADRGAEEFERYLEWQIGSLRKFLQQAGLGDPAAIGSIEPICTDGGVDFPATRYLVTYRDGRTARILVTGARRKRIPAHRRLYGGCNHRPDSGDVLCAPLGGDRCDRGYAAAQFCQPRRE